MTFSERKIRTIIPLDDDPDYKNPSGFCAWMNFTAFSDFWDVPAVFDSVEQSVTLENFSGFANATYASDERWKASEGFVSFENEVIEIENPSVFDQVIAIGDLAQELFLGGVYITSAGGGTIRDLITGAPFGEIVIQTGYICGIRFNSGTTEVFLSDNQGNEFSGLAASGFNPDNELLLVFQFAGSNVQKYVNKINTGSRPFGLPQSSGTYCNQIYIPSPPPLTCETPTLVEIPAGDFQIINITDQDVEAISVGNFGVTGITGTGSQCRFTTQTDVVKYEAELVGLSNASASNDAAFAMYFIDFQDELNPEIVAGVYFIPQGFSTNAFVLDLVSGMPVSISIEIVPDFISAFYLDSASGTAWFKTSDSGTNEFSISVNPLYDNALEITEGVAVLAGQFSGESITVRMNFGGIFNLGNDAKRWCEV